MERLNELEKSHRVASLVNTCIVVSLIIYAVVVEVIRRQLEHFVNFVDAPEFTKLRYIFYGITILNIFLIRSFRRMLLKKRLYDDLKILIGKLLRSSIITAAFCEVPAILGLVLFFIAGSVRDFYYLSIISIILVFLHFPKYKNWEEWIKNQSSCAPVGRLFEGPDQKKDKA